MPVAEFYFVGPDDAGRNAGQFVSVEMEDWAFAVSRRVACLLANRANVMAFAICQADGVACLESPAISDRWFSV